MRTRHAVCALLLCVLAARAEAQAAPSAVVAALPERVDTMTASIDGTVIGRGITTWVRVGLEQLQVYVWTSAGDGFTITDSLFSDPNTLLPVRQVRVLGDTTFLVHYGRDSLFLSRVVEARTSTSHAPAPTVELYSSSAVAQLAATMPLRAGASRSALVFYAPPSTIGSAWVVLVVDARVQLNGRNAWRVMANTRTGSTTYWVDERTRSILQTDELEGATRVLFRRSR